MDEDWRDNLQLLFPKAYELRFARVGLLAYSPLGRPSHPVATQRNSGKDAQRLLEITAAGTAPELHGIPLTKA